MAMLNALNNIHYPNWMPYETSFKVSNWKNGIGLLNLLQNVPEMSFILNGCNVEMIDTANGGECIVVLMKLSKMCYVEIKT